MSPIMKTTSAITAIALAFIASAGAQTFVLDSPVIIQSRILTQGPDETVTRRGNTVLVKSTERRLFGNLQILERMIELGLLSGSASQWKLVYLSDETGAGGLYAKQSGTTPVAVPAELLTLPVFGPSIMTGRETTGPNGVTYVGITEIAAASISVDGIPAAGHATNGIRTVTTTLDGVRYQLETVTTSMTFTGGSEDTPSDRLVDGSIAIGKAELSELDELP